MPTRENITSSKYPIPRLYFAYVNRISGKPLNPGVNEFLRFVLAQEGQNAIADIGLIPGPPEFLTITLKRLDRWVDRGLRARAKGTPALLSSDPSGRWAPGAARMMGFRGSSCMTSAATTTSWT